MITKTTKTITTMDGSGKVISVQEQVETVESPDVKVITTEKLSDGSTVQTQTVEGHRKRRYHLDAGEIKEN